MYLNKLVTSQYTPTPYSQVSNVLFLLTTTNATKFKAYLLLSPAIMTTISARKPERKEREERRQD